jgi:hypothetical protein
VVSASTWTTCSTCHLALLPQSRVPEASGAGGARKACFQTGAHAPGVCHHCCRRLPRDHARKRAQGTTVLTALANPIPLSLQYVKGASEASYFPVSAITDRLYARNQLTYKRVQPPMPVIAWLFLVLRALRVSVHHAPHHAASRA